MKNTASRELSAYYSGSPNRQRVFSMSGYVIAFAVHFDGLGHKPFKSWQAFFQNDDKNDKTHRAQNVYLSRPTWRGTKRLSQ